MPAGYCIFLCGILLICPANNRTDYEIQEGTSAYYMRPIKNSKEYAAVFLTGAAVYSLIEILWRGRTHWTMAVTGGICMLLIHRCNERHSTLDLLGRCSLCSFYITGVEFAVGCLLNLRLNMMVWDYSDRYLNVMGQICPEYWAYWYLLSIPAIMLSTIVLAVRKATGGEVNF